MKTGKGEKGFTGELTDAALEEVLGNFKASVHAWSEAAYSRPRPVTAVRHWNWRLAAGWALGCVMAAGSLTGGLHERHLRLERNLERSQILEQARIAAAEQARQQQLAAKEKSVIEDSDLLATVDTDVSQAVPSAMEPLAQLMDDDTNQ